MSPTYGSGESTTRRIAIADAAIALLAADGMPALTHRKIDQKIGLPAGSTSYYFRSRGALIDAAVNRIVELDDDDMTAVVGKSSAIAAAQPAGPSDAALITQLFDVWSAPERRDRLVARFELLLATSRGPAPNPILEARRHFTQRTTKALSDAGLPNADELAIVLASMFDGMLLDVVVSGGADRESRSQLLTRLGQLLLPSRPPGIEA